jgi:hypothetical protein
MPDHAPPAAGTEKYGYWLEWKGTTERLLAEKATVDGWHIAAERDGFRLADGYEVHTSFQERMKVNGVPLLTDDELTAGLTGDDYIVRAWGWVVPR